MNSVKYGYLWFIFASKLQQISMNFEPGSVYPPQSAVIIHNLPVAEMSHPGFLGIVGWCLFTTGIIGLWLLQVKLDLIRIGSQSNQTNGHNHGCKNHKLGYGPPVAMVAYQCISTVKWNRALRRWTKVGHPGPPRNLRVCHGTRCGTQPWKS